MNKKLIIISGIVLMMALTAVTIPAIAETDDNEKLGRTRITAIGTFAHCDVDGVIYGHIFIGVKGIKPVFNFDIEICDDTIRSIIMTNHLLHCVFVE
jgi:hypothetical protein